MSIKLFAKKSLGQHFLTSKHVLEQIILAANIQKGETVLEIGPGTGILTSALIEAGANIIAVEKDDRACALLSEKFAHEIKNGRLKLIHGDILDDNILYVPSVDQSTRSTTNKQISLVSNGNYALIANIPYYITGSILEKFLEHEPRPNRMVLLMQKEVADRIVAKDISGLENSGKGSVLSNSVKAFGTPEIVAKVPPGAFTPPPSIDSAILSINNISDTRFTENNVEISWFFNIIKTAFAHKRKYAIRNLETVISSKKLQNIFGELNLDPKIRAENIRLEQWFEIIKRSSN